MLRLQENTTLRDLLFLLPGIISGAGLAGCIWSVVEAIQLSGKEGTSFLLAWALSGTAAMISGLLIALLLWAFIVAVYYLKRIAAPHSSFNGRNVLVLTIAFLFTSYGVYCIYYLFERIFAGVGVKAIALSVSLPLLLAITFIIGHRLVSRFLSVPRIHLRPIWWIGIVTTCACLWALSFSLLETDVFTALRLSQYWPFWITLALGVFGGFITGWKKLHFAAVSIFPSILAVLSLTHLTVFAGEPGNNIPIQRTNGTRLVFDLLHSGALTKVGKISFAKGPTCFPQIPPPDPGSQGKARKRAPDIIFFTIDSLRWDHTSLAGYRRDTTPNLARWSKSAVVFSNAHVSATWTRQSFRSLFTGLHPSQVPTPNPKLKKWGVSFHKNQLTLASYLTAAGYHTVAVVARKVNFYKHDNARVGFAEVDETPAYPDRRLRYAAPFQVDRIIGHLSVYKREKPRFVWTHIIDTHKPYVRPSHTKSFGDEHMDNYDSSIHYVDAELDRLLSFARGPARRNNVYVIVTADHGEAFREHNANAHGQTAYNEETRVPLLIWGPRIRPRRIDTAVSLIDIPPTILDIAGLEPVKSFCGESFFQYTKSRDDFPTREIYTENVPDFMRNEFSVAYTKGRYKLVLWPRNGSMELYDVESDPIDKYDISGERIDVLASMKDSLKTYYKKRGMDPSFYGFN
ncbi:MAG: sulfatase-like hydrolase/transferase [Proteobacteria bacterium]|nr:sulfatase-like hydrolase/transferase [Pseudomonadota bacterium]